MCECICETQTNTTKHILKLYLCACIHPHTSPNHFHKMPYSTFISNFISSFCCVSVFFLIIGATWNIQMVKSMLEIPVRYGVKKILHICCVRIPNLTYFSSSCMSDSLLCKVPTKKGIRSSKKVSCRVDFQLWDWLDDWKFLESAFFFCAWKKIIDLFSWGTWLAMSWEILICFFVDVN